jgi:hypothetical protein
MHVLTPEAFSRRGLQKHQNTKIESEPAKIGGGNSVGAAARDSTFSNVSIIIKHYVKLPKAILIRNLVLDQHMVELGTQEKKTLLCRLLEDEKKKQPGVPHKFSSHPCGGK